MKLHFSGSEFQTSGPEFVDNRSFVELEGFPGNFGLSKCFSESCKSPFHTLAIRTGTPIQCQPIKLTRKRRWPSFSQNDILVAPRREEKFKQLSPTFCPWLPSLAKASLAKSLAMQLVLHLREQHLRLTFVSMPQCLRDSKPKRPSRQRD